MTYTYVTYYSHLPYWKEHMQIRSRYPCVELSENRSMRSWSTLDNCTWLYMIPIDSEVWICYWNLRSNFDIHFYSGIEHLIDFVITISAQSMQFCTDYRKNEGWHMVALESWPFIDQFGDVRSWTFCVTRVKIYDGNAEMLKWIIIWT